MDFFGIPFLIKYTEYISFIENNFGVLESDTVIIIYFILNFMKLYFVIKAIQLVYDLGFKIFNGFKNMIARRRPKY